MGIILFWVCYLFSGIGLYTLFRGLYVQKKIDLDSYPYWKYEKTDERFKIPLWMILLAIIIFCIPIVNISIPFALIVGENYSEEFYIKTFLTKKY